MNLFGIPPLEKNQDLIQSMMITVTFESRKLLMEIINILTYRHGN